MALPGVMASRAISAVGVLVVALLMAACGDDSAPAEGDAYARELEAIVEAKVSPATIAARDALVNVLQGGSPAAAAHDLRRAAQSLREAEAQLRDLKAPNPARVAANDLAGLAGDLADAIARPNAAGLASEAAAQLDVVDAHDRAIVALAGAVAELARATSAQPE